MSYYGYNPSEYKNDFSWLGDIGAAVSKSAHVMPELWKLNQEIKENKFLKEKTYKEMTDWVDKFSDEEANAVAASMGLEYTNPMEAKAQLKQRMLNPSTLGEISNEEYIKRFATESIVPLYNAVSSEKNPNPNVDMGRLVARIPSGTVQEAFGGTSAGKTMAEDAQYQKSFQRRGVELQRELDMRNQSQLDLDNQRYAIEQQRSSDVYSQVNDVLSNVKKSDQVWSSPGLDQYDPKAREKAYETLAKKETNELRLQLKDMDQQIRQLQSTNKPVSVDVVDDLLNSIDSKVMQKGAQLDAHLKNKDAKKASPNIYDQQTAKIKRELEELKIRQSKAMDTKLNFLENGKFTTEGLNQASKQSELNYETKIKPQEEKEMIDLYNNNIKTKAGGFSEGGWGKFGRGDDLERFISAYKTRFGVEPVIKDGVPIPQFGGSTGTQTTPGGGINLRMSPSTKKTDDDLIKEIMGQ